MHPDDADTAIVSTAVGSSSLSFMLGMILNPGLPNLSPLPSTQAILLNAFIITVGCFLCLFHT